MNFWQDFKAQYQLGGYGQKLIYWNCGIFLLSILFFYQFRWGVFQFPTWLALSSDLSSVAFQPWTLFTYSFLHAGFFHLLFNMMVLHYAGQLFLTFFSQRQLLGVYLLSAVFSGLCFSGLYPLLTQGNQSMLVGASGSVMAILVAAATYAPRMNIRLMLLGNVLLWQLTAVILFLDLIQILVENTGGHIAHLAGAFLGWAYVRLLQNGTDLSRPVAYVLDLFAPNKSAQKSPFKKIHRSHPVRPAQKTARVVLKDKTQQQIDDILDKISQSGYESLTQDEKEFLFKAGKQ